MAEIKPGYKSTEFWICLFVIAIGMFQMSGVFGDGHPVMQGVSMLSSVLASLGYTAARAKAKFGQNLENAAAKKPNP